LDMVALKLFSVAAYVFFGETSMLTLTMGKTEISSLMATSAIT
jgi:hypothetical protein